ncbi:MAG: phage recombination protein Bet [Methanosarcinales archaeon]|nr:phage recombination protein Bet [Methanosarcinales archaeon]
MNEMEPTDEQKIEMIVQALGIAGFTEKEQFLGMYTQEHGMKTIVVNLNESPIKSYFNVDGKKITEDDEHKTLAKVDKMITEAEDGRTPTKTKPDIIVNIGEKEGTPQHQEETINQETAQYIKDTESLSDDDPAKVTAKMFGEHVPVVPEAPHALTPAMPSDLSVSTIKKYINDKATDEEAYVFLQLCKARGLNPFLKEAYLIKYDHVSPATMVVGKDAFMKRAELHPEYDGFEAGIIVETEGKEGFVIADNCRVGTFYYDNEILLGGWAKVYRKDHKHPVEITVNMREFSTGKSSWNKMPATMIRKVALVQALREAFPSELSGMYDQSEMGVEVIT